MQKSKDIFCQLESTATEQRNTRTMQIDLCSVRDILNKINKEDQKVARAVSAELSFIAQAVELVIDSFKHGGRLIYVGAGTSGRLGILDAAECPPTFGTNPGMIRGIIAGGRKAVFRSQEGAEDSTRDAARDIRLLKLSEKDVVCGIAASMRTPYVLAAVKEAKRHKARTIFITTNPRSSLKTYFRNPRKDIDVAICPEVGPEVIMGSTRMKSGTAQKLVLNMITTASMVRLGKVYENMMIDLKMNSKKLEERAKRVLMIATGVDYATAEKTLKKVGGHVKTAIVMIKLGVTARQANARLKKANGFVRKAIKG